MSYGLTCAVSPAQNSPCWLVQIIRRTRTIRQAKIRMEIRYILSVSIRRLSWTSSTYLERGQFNRGKADSRGNAQVVHLLTNHPDITEIFQYPMSPDSGFSEMNVTQREEISPVCYIVVLSLSFQPCVRNKQIVNLIPSKGKGSLTPNTE